MIISTSTADGFSKLTVGGDMVRLHRTDTYVSSFESSAIANPSPSLTLVNATLAIDLTKSWNTADVNIIETMYEANSKPTVNDPALLVDRSSEAIYSWGGFALRDAEVSFTPQLWKFKPDGAGRGEWEDATPERDHTFLASEWTRESAAVSTNRSGFIFGGFLTDRQTSSNDFITSPGFLAFDFDTQEWSREVFAPYSPTNTIISGEAIFAPDYGPNGLVFVFGGSRTWNIGQELETMSFETLHFMDPVTRDWYSQNVTGSMPGHLTHFCSAGVSAGNGIFDMWVCP